MPSAVQTRNKTALCTDEIKTVGKIFTFGPSGPSMPTRPGDPDNPGSPVEQYRGI